MTMTGTHDRYLVILSVLIATFASFTALDLAARMRVAAGRARHVWLAAAATALGGGIWSMHFVAMLAFSIPGMEMSYDFPLTLASLALALLFTGAGFTVLGGGRVSVTRIVPAGLLMGGGVLAMHYLGMAAMRMPGTVSYERWWFSASVLIAIGAAMAALWLAARDRKPLHRLMAAGVMGVAIAGMHYAGMRAAVFNPATTDMTGDDASIGQTQLAVIISAITIAILALALGAAQVERLFRASSRREARAVLRLEVADVLRGQDITEALHGVAALIGSYFSVSRTGYGQFDEAANVFDYDVCWTDGTMPPLLGRFPAAAFGSKITAALSAGRTVAIDDLTTSELSDEAHTHGTTRDVDTRAILVVPFLREGRLNTIVYLTAREARNWRARDVAFVEEIAERTRLVIERAAVEQQLRDLNATLEEKVAAEVDARMQTEEALRQSQKVEAIGQLTGGVAHDFNNLLTVICGSVDLLRRPGVPQERATRYIDAIADAADHATKLTGQLLAFARRQALKPEVFDVAANLSALREMIATLAGSRIRIKLKLSEEPCFIDADPTQFDTAIVNMAANARDAMKGEGELELRVGTALRMPAIRGHSAVNGDFVTVSINDSGGGIAARDLQRIFEPFYTTKGVGEGTGLGLSQVFGFAKQSGGDVAVKSEVGRGTTFTLFLPRATPHEQRASTHTVVHLPSIATGACVLVVEDNPEVGRFAVETLSELGYASVYAANAAAALAELATGADRFHVVFSDIVMPGTSGLDLARAIRERHPELPVVLTSGYSHALAEEGSSGFDLLHKPYSVEQLARALAGAVARAPQVAING